MLNIVIIILVNLIVYWRSLGYAYVCDDIPVSQKPTPKAGFFMRLWYQIIGKHYYSAAEAHAVTLATHTIVCILIYFAFGANRFSLICALLFSVNPVNHQVSLWISGRIYGLATIAGLLMWIFPLFAPVFFLPVYVYGISNIYLFPLIFIGTKYWYWSGLAGLIFIHMRLRQGATENKLKNKGISSEMTKLHPRKIILFAKTYGYYFRLGLTARPLCLYHNLLQGYGLTDEYNKQAYALDRDFWIGICVLYFAGTNIIFNPGQSFGLLWFTICIVQWCNVITISQYIAERYLYLAEIGLMYTVARCITYLPQPHQNYLFIGVMVYYAARLWFYMPAYKNDFWHIEFNLIEQWDNLRARFSRAYHKFKMKEYRGAYFDYMVIAQKYPNDFKLLYNIANMLLAQGLLDMAEETLKRAENNLYRNNEKPLALELIAHTRRAIEDAREHNGVDENRLRILQ